MYYTLYFSMSLCLASLLIAYHYPENPKVFCWHPGCAPHYFIAGGNFVSGFGTAAILFIAIAITYLEQKKLPKFLTCILLVYLAAFSFSILAPGNAFRELAVKESHPNIIAAIGITLSKSIGFIDDRFISLMSLTFVTLIPIVNRLARKSQFKFHIRGSASSLHWAYTVPSSFHIAMPWDTRGQTE